MQIHDYICFCVTHLLRACCDYECLNFGTSANFVYNLGGYGRSVNGSSENPE